MLQTSNQSSILNIEIVYASPSGLTRLEILIPQGSTIEEALQQSEFFQRHPELTLNTLSVGIYGERVPLNYVLNNYDRIEIYRLLEMDPKTRRRLRHAAKQSSSSRKG